MNDPDRAATWPANIDDDLPEHLWAPLGLMVDDEPLRSGATGGLVSLAFFREALGRAKWVWCATAALGLLIGSGLYLRYPPAYHAEASVVLVDAQNTDPEVDVLTDQSVADSQPVAASVVRELGLQQSVASFRDEYTVTVVTPNVLTLDVSARSSAAAVQRVAAVATAFLQYRAKYEQTQEQQQLAQLAQEVNTAEQNLHTLDSEIDAMPSPQVTQLTRDQQTRLDKLQTQAGAAKGVIVNNTAAEAAAKTATLALVSGSYVLNPAAPVKQSRAKAISLYVAGGLFGGLVVGMAGVIVAALLSDRLRRRDDVAAALGAPVRLSVGSLRAPARWRPVRPRRAQARDRDVKRIAAYLRGAVSGSPYGPASLAVVAVDDAQTVAPAVLELARSGAKAGRQVVVADLSAGHSLARLLGVRAPGIHPVTRDGAPIQVAVPARADVAPVGPVRGTDAPATWAEPDQALVAACSSADLLLTLVTLDPAVGGDHLTTWASEAIVAVTAGRSSAERVHSVGEMVRLAGIRFNSAVMIGADKSDASLGFADSAARPAESAAGGKAHRTANTDSA
ncbi:MAG: hypothetical protein ACRDN0_16240 [Trebonia sp.]